MTVVCLHSISNLGSTNKEPCIKFFFLARPEKLKYLFKSLNTEGSKHKYKVGQRTVHSRLSQSLSGG